ncbi:hypothetical protein BGZ67_001075, partial [Mortierella alpina]
MTLTIFLQDAALPRLARERQCFGPQPSASLHEEQVTIATFTTTFGRQFSTFRPVHKENSGEVENLSKVYASAEEAVKDIPSGSTLM